MQALTIPAFIKQMSLFRPVSQITMLLQLDNILTSPKEVKQNVEKHKNPHHKLQ